MKVSVLYITLGQYDSFCFVGNTWYSMIVSVFLDNTGSIMIVSVVYITLGAV